MTIGLFISLCLITGLGYLALRWCRARLAMHRFRKLGEHWKVLEQTWTHLGNLPASAHTRSIRTCFASLQRAHLQALRELAPQHSRTAVHARLVSQYLRGAYTPPQASSEPRTRVRLDSASQLRSILTAAVARQIVDKGAAIRADAELNQWQARLQLDDFTANAMRDALLGRRREALQSLQQALACLPRLPIADSEAWRGKLMAEQRRLRTSLTSNARRHATAG